MFYDGLGRLLAHASDALREEVRPHVTEERARTQLDAVAALCADVGAMWPLLFEALEAENRLLGSVASETDAGGGLERYDALLRQINAEIDERHPDAGRLEALRSALLAAAAVQQGVVDHAARASTDGALKRI